MQILGLEATLFHTPTPTFVLTLFLRRRPLAQAAIPLQSNQNTLRRYRLDTRSSLTERMSRNNVVNDIPTEAEFDPSRWGTFVLE